MVMKDRKLSVRKWIEKRIRKRRRKKTLRNREKTFKNSGCTSKVTVTRCTEIDFVRKKSNERLLKSLTQINQLHSVRQMMVAQFIHVRMWGLARKNRSIYQNMAQAPTKQTNRMKTVVDETTKILINSSLEMNFTLINNIIFFFFGCR